MASRRRSRCRPRGRTWCAPRRPMFARRELRPGAVCFAPRRTRAPRVGKPATRRRSPGSRAAWQRPAPTRRSRPPLASGCAGPACVSRRGPSYRRPTRRGRRWRPRCPAPAPRPTTRKIRTGESGQGSVHDGPIENRHHPVGGHEDVVGDRVVTAGAAQSQRVPVIQELKVFRWHRDDGRDGLFVDHASGEHHVGVTDAAAKWPLPRHHDAAVDRASLAAWRPHARGQAAPVAEQLIATRLR